jgi:hypothetical protein
MLTRPERCAVATPELQVMRHGRPNSIEPVSSTVSALIWPTTWPAVDRRM